MCANARPRRDGRALHWASVNVYTDLFRRRELFTSLFRRDLRAKYRGSALGLLWALALPVTLMLVYLVVFAVLWKAAPTTAVDDYWLFLLCGLPPWAFFSSSVQTSSRSLLENASIIRKVRFPRQLVPLSVVATQVVAFAAMLAIVLGLSLWFREDARGTAWLAIPVACLIVAFVAGLLARHRLRERHLPRCRVRHHRAAAALVLPDADPLQRRRPAGDRVLSMAR